MITLHRLFVPTGKSSLTIARCDVKGLACSLDDLAGQESPEDYHLALGSYALKSSTKIEQILVNFETPRGTSTILAPEFVKYSRRQIARTFWGICMPLDTFSVWRLLLGCLISFTTIRTWEKGNYLRKFSV